MTHCLREYVLVMLYIGEGTQEEHNHLASCERCAQQYQHLVHDWQRIEHLLRTPPPQPMKIRSAVPFPQRWVPITAMMVVATVLVVLASTHWSQIPLLEATATISPVDAVRFVETTVVPALFANDALPADVLPTPVSDETYVQAALDGEWPCEQEVSPSSLSCGVHSFPLFIGG